MTSGKINNIIAASLFVIMLAIYLMTVAPTLSFWDCGEFITCSYIMGIPHPPGSPMLSLIGRVFSLIPFYDFRGTGLEEIAYRVNMIDVFLGALTVMLTYLIMVRLIRKFRPPTGNKFEDAIVMFSGIITAFMVAFSDEFWSNAIETETYMPSIFMSMLAVWLVLRWDERSDDPKTVRYLFLAAYLIGLGNGVHLTVLLIAPTVFLLVLFTKPHWFSDHRLWFYGALLLIGAAMIKLFAGLEILYFSMALFAFVAPYVLYRLYSQRHPLWILVLLGMVFCGSLYIIGFSAYPTVMVRAGKNPSINEGNPDNWERYKLYMSRDQYGQENMYIGMFTRLAEFKYQFSFMYLRYLIQQFPKWGPTIEVLFHNNRSPDSPNQDVKIVEPVYVSVLLVSLLLYGLYTHGREDWKRFSALIVFFIVSSVGLILYLNMKNPQVRERAYFFLGSFYIIMYWIGMGVYGLITDVREFLQEKNLSNIIPGTTIGLFVIFGTLIPAGIFSNHIDPHYNNYQAHNRSGDWAPWDYGYNILTSCEKDAVLFTNGDNDTFPLWYLQEVVGFRKDIRIVNLSLINTDWYILQMKYGYAGVPLEISKDMRINNLNLDGSGGDFKYEQYGAKTLPIEFSDDHIENRLCGKRDEDLALRVWPVEGREVEAAGIKWTLPTYHDFTLRDGTNLGMIRIQDVMVYKIIDWINWSRPLYFAVTVARENKIGLEDYLSMEGMVSRIVPERAQPGKPLVNVKKLDENVFTKYQYRSLTDDDIYKPPNTIKLVTNYFIGFAQLCERYITDGDKENAVRAAKGAIDYTVHDLPKRLLLYKILAASKIYDELKPMIEDEVNATDFVSGHEGFMEDRLEAAELLHIIGEKEKAQSILETEYNRLDLETSREKLDFGTTLLQNSLDNLARTYFKQLTVEDSTNVDVWKAYAASLYASRDFEETKRVLDHMKKMAPDDKSVQDIIDILSDRMQ
ncbi:MAG: DUF2723 domain-containing protein [Candidatus Latescibacteria bacterium]|nr:DUF2723 domain-containing protein [Candidatus Latescibacterota bacterium]